MREDVSNDRELLALLRQGSYSDLVGSLAAAWLILFIGREAGLARGLIWAGGLSLVFLWHGLRLWLLPADLSTLDERRVARWMRVFVLAMALRGAGWALSLLAFNAAPPPRLMLLTLCVCVVIAVGSSYLAVKPRVLIAFLLGSCGTMALVFAWNGGTDNYALAIGVLIMGGMLYAYGGNITSTALMDSIRLAKANRRLVDELALRNAQLQAQSLELERTSLAKTRFLAAASHDLRQPIAATTTLVSVLRERIRYPEVRAIADRLDDSVRAMESLLVGLLDVSRLDAGAMQPEFRPVRLQALLAAVAAHAQAQADSQGLQLVIRCPDVWVRSDPLILERIVRNLVDNALRYTIRGRVLVAVRGGAEGSVRLQVRDSGVGIAEADQARVFEEFFQVGNSGRDRRLGLGLGLSIVRRAARLLGTDVSLRSCPSKGTTMSLRLPRAEATAQAESHDDEAPVAGFPLAGMRIWLVEDDLLLRQALTLRLSAWGAEVREWAGCAEALALLADGLGMVPDALVTDYRLAEGNSLSLIQALLAASNGGADNDAPALVVITGDGGPAQLALAPYREVKVLDKPFTMEALLAAVLRRRMPEIAGPG